MSDPDPWIVQFEERHRAKADARRTFTLFGEEFRLRATIAPEVAFRFNEFARDLDAFMLEIQAADREGREPARSWLGTDELELLGLCEATIRRCLDPDSIPAWERLRDPDRPDPFDLWEIYGFARYTIVKAAEPIPTDAPTVSSNGREPTTGSSKAASPSPGRQPRTSRSKAT